MNAQHSRSKELLSKVYDHLDTIDVTKLSMNELKDFLGVVQQGQFLESYGQIPGFGFGGNPFLCGNLPIPQEKTDNWHADLWCFLFLTLMFGFSLRAENPDLKAAKSLLAQFEKETGEEA